MIEAKIDRQHQEDLQRLRGFCLLDDEFMVKCLEDETACMELILRIILEKPDLRVTKVDGRDYDQVPPQRSLQLDVWATDSQEKKIFVRFKKIGPGVEKCHVRYSSSISDVDLVRFCGDIQNLPDLYIVLITENDELGGGFPSHRIQWYDQTVGVPFEDGAHVIYVNGAYRGDSPIGKLVHDLMCTDPSKMYYRALADRVHFYKETEEGAAIMCRAMEASREQCMAYYKEENSKEIAGRMLADGVLPLEKIMEYSGLDDFEVGKLQLAAEEA